MDGRIPKCMFRYLICSNSSCDPSTLLGGFFVCQDLGPSILYFFLPLCLVICFIGDRQVFIKIHHFQACYHGIICLASLLLSSFCPLFWPKAQVYDHSLAPIIFVDTGPSVFWSRTKIIVKSSTINPIWTTTWRPQFALYFQTNKHSNTAIWYLFQKFKSTCNLMNQLTCPL